MANLSNINNKFLVTTGGNVGINTTSPEEKLNVIGSVLISNNEFYKVENTTGTNYKIAGLTNGNVIQIGAIDYTSAGTIFAGGDNISITTGGASGTTRVKIDSSGNVGIGTTSPSDYNASARNLVVYSTGNTGITIASNNTSSDGTIRFADGTGGTAGYRGSIQYAHNGDFMNFNTAAVERMRIESSGNVQLQTVGAQLRFQNSAGAAPYIKNSGENSSTAPYGQNLEFYTGGSKALTLDNSQNATFAGNVGIGISPNQNFHIYKDDAIALIQASNTNGTAQLQFIPRDASNVASLQSIKGVDSSLTFLTGGNSGNSYVPTERMRITSGGNVAIGGTLGADSQFRVELKPAGTILAGLRIGYNSTSNNYFDGDNQYFRNGLGSINRMVIDSSGNSIFYGTIKSFSTGAAHLILNGDTNNSGDTGEVDAIIDLLGDGNPGIYGYRINTENWSGQTALNFQEYLNGSYTSRLFISKDGNVGIGTTSPSYKLAVNGDLRVEGNSSGTSASFGGNGDFAIDAPGVGGGRFVVKHSTGNVGIGTSSPRAKLEVNGELIAQDIKHSNFAVSSLSTTGYTIATVTGGGNGQSAQIEFIGMGGTSGIVDVVYSCTNQGGNWYAYKKARQTPTIVDVDVTGHGTTTLSFIFKSLSGTASYTPRLMMKGSPSALVTF
jgi:hypothetical protein